MYANGSIPSPQLTITILHIRTYIHTCTGTLSVHDVKSKIKEAGKEPSFAVGLDSTARPLIRPDTSNATANVDATRSNVNLQSVINATLREGSNKVASPRSSATALTSNGASPKVNVENVATPRDGTPRYGNSDGNGTPRYGNGNGKPVDGSYGNVNLISPSNARRLNNSKSSVLSHGNTSPTGTLAETQQSVTNAGIASPRRDAAVGFGANDRSEHAGNLEGSGAVAGGTPGVLQLNDGSVSRLVYVCVCICIYIYVCMCVCIYIYIYIYICI
jgi:hypothetical protein